MKLLPLLLLLLIPLSGIEAKRYDLGKRLEKSRIKRSIAQKREKIKERKKEAKEKVTSIWKRIRRFLKGIFARIRGKGPKDPDQPGPGEPINEVPVANFNLEDTGDPTIIKLSPRQPIQTGALLL